MPKPTWTRLRNVRVNDDVWAAAKARAIRDGLPLSQVIVAFLTDYAATDDKPTNGKRKRS